MGKFDHDETCSISFCATVDHSTSGTTTIITSTPAGSTEVDQIDTENQVVGPKSSIGEYYGDVTVTTERRPKHSTASYPFQKCPFVSLV